MLKNKHFLLGLSKVLEIKHNKNLCGNSNIKIREAQSSCMHDNNDLKINNKNEEPEIKRNTEQTYKNVSPKKEVENECENGLFDASLSSIIMYYLILLLKKFFKIYFFSSEQTF